MAAANQGGGHFDPYLSPDRVPSRYTNPNFDVFDEANYKAWNARTIKSRRTGRYLPKKPLKEMTDGHGRKIFGLSQLAKDPDIPRSRTYFQDYDVIDGEGSWGRCLCEIRFYSGEKCKPHVCSDKDGNARATNFESRTYSKTDAGRTKIERPKAEPNKHWAWYIDTAPRGMVCPIAKYRFRKQRGKVPAEDIACPISFDEVVPYEAWVLGQQPGAGPNTLPLKVDHYLREDSNDPASGLCPRCRVESMKKKPEPHGKEIVTEQNRWIKPVAVEMEKFEVKEDGMIQPYRYRPDPKEDSPINIHPTLVLDHFYHLWDINHIIEVTGIMIPRSAMLMEDAVDDEEKHTGETSLDALDKRNEAIEKRLDDEDMAFTKLVNDSTRLKDELRDAEEDLARRSYN